MRSLLKSARLDFALLKPYAKSICFVILVPVAFLFVSRSLISGISFAMCVMSMSSSYTFAVSEKNGMHRLYGILPVTKKNLVLGKYLCVCGMGLLALIISLILQPLVLVALSVPVDLQEILTAGLMGIVMFVLYIVFQIPGYYKYGSIKGRVFMYLPVVGFLLISVLFGSNKAVLSPVLANLLGSPVMTVGTAILFMVLMLLVSTAVSVKILKNKEL